MLTFHILLQHPKQFAALEKAAAIPVPTVRKHQFMHSYDASLLSICIHIYIYKWSLINVQVS